MHTNSCTYEGSPIGVEANVLDRDIAGASSISSHMITFTFGLILMPFVFNWNHFEMRLLNLRINFYLLRTFCPHFGRFFFVLSSFTTFRPNFTSGLLQVILPRPRIGMMSLVTVFPVITAFHSCCLSHHVFDQVNLWPAWVGFETAIFCQCSPGTVETQRLYPLRRRAIKDGLFGLKNPYLVFL